MNDIRHRVGIRAPLRDVCEATFLPEKLQAWWAASATGSDSGALGAQIVLEFPGFPNHVWEIVELAVDKRVRLRLLEGPQPWHGSELCFEFEETDEQIFVTLTHTTGPETPAAAHQYFCTKWPLFLVSLKQYLETGRGMPYPDDIRIQHG